MGLLANELSEYFWCIDRMFMFVSDKVCDKVIWNENVLEVNSYSQQTVFAGPLLV